GLWGSVLAALGALCVALSLVGLRRRAPRLRSLPSLAMFFGFIGAVSCMTMWPGFFILHYSRLEQFQLPNATNWGRFVFHGLTGVALSEFLLVLGCYLTNSLAACMSCTLAVPLACVAGIAFFHRPASEIWRLSVGGPLTVLAFVAALWLPRVGDPLLSAVIAFRDLTAGPAGVLTASSTAINDSGDSDSSFEADNNAIGYDEDSDGERLSRRQQRRSRRIVRHSASAAAASSVAGPSTSAGGSLFILELKKKDPGLNRRVNGGLAPTAQRGSRSLGRQAVASLAGQVVLHVGHVNVFAFAVVAGQLDDQALDPSRAFFLAGGMKKENSMEMPWGELGVVILVLGRRQRLGEGEERVRQIQEAVLVVLELLPTLQQFVELQADQADSYGGCGGDGGHNAAGNEFSLVPVGLLNIVVGRPQVAASGNKIHVIVRVVVFLEFHHSDGVGEAGGGELRLGFEQILGQIVQRVRLGRGGHGQLALQLRVVGCYADARPGHELGHTDGTRQLADGFAIAESPGDAEHESAKVGGGGDELAVGRVGRVEGQRSDAVGKIFRPLVQQVGLDGLQRLNALVAGQSQGSLHECGIVKELVQSLRLLAEHALQSTNWRGFLRRILRAAVGLGEKRQHNLSVGFGPCGAGLHQRLPIINTTPINVSPGLDVVQCVDNNGEVFKEIIGIDGLGLWTDSILLRFDFEIRIHPDGSLGDSCGLGAANVPGPEQELPVQIALLDPVHVGDDHLTTAAAGADAHQGEVFQQLAAQSACANQEHSGGAEARLNLAGVPLPVGWRHRGCGTFGQAFERVKVQKLSDRIEPARAGLHHFLAGCAANHGMDRGQLTRADLSEGGRQFGVGGGLETLALGDLLSDSGQLGGFRGVAGLRPAARMAGFELGQGLGIDSCTIDQASVAQLTCTFRGAQPFNGVMPCTPVKSTMKFLHGSPFLSVTENASPKSQKMPPNRPAAEARVVHQADRLHSAEDDILSNLNAQTAQAADEHIGCGHTAHSFVTEHVQLPTVQRPQSNSRPAWAAPAARGRCGQQSQLRAASDSKPVPEPSNEAPLCMHSNPLVKSLFFLFSARLAARRRGNRRGQRPMLRRSERARPGSERRRSTSVPTRRQFTLLLAAVLHHATEAATAHGQLWQSGRESLSDHEATSSPPAQSESECAVRASSDASREAVADAGAAGEAGHAQPLTKGYRASDKPPPGLSGGGPSCGHRQHRISLRDTASPAARGRQGLAEWAATPPLAASGCTEPPAAESAEAGKVAFEPAAAAEAGKAAFEPAAAAEAGKAAFEPAAAAEAGKAALSQQLQRAVRVEQLALDCSAPLVGFAPGEILSSAHEHAPACLGAERIRTRQSPHCRQQLDYNAEKRLKRLEVA
uniref:EamA domain-containing protein n=1 Tax=Macrostomum lignano TaxID=282301 RepID=A0A1I8HEK8_9PLAT